MSTTLCHIVWGTWAFLAITRCEGNIGYGFTRMSYFRPFLPSNCIELCSGGRFSAHRKHFLALIEALSTLAAEERIRSGLCWHLTFSPPTSISLISAFLSERKLEEASGHTESWSLINLDI